MTPQAATEQRHLESLRHHLGFNDLPMALRRDAGGRLQLVESGPRRWLRSPIAVERGAYVWADSREHIAGCGELLAAIWAILNVRSVERPKRERTWAFTAEETSVRSARTQLAAALTEWGYPHGLIDDAQTIVSELGANAVRYGEGGRYYVRVRREPGFLFVEVADDSAEYPVMREPDDSGDERGRGLVLVNGLAAGWGTGPSDMGLTKIVWAKLTAPR